jgi:carbonic anhydrase
MDMPSILIDGYRRFKQQRFLEEAERYRSLAFEQNPQTMIIGCADSRVDPATIFSAAPGELFVVRNIAALVPPFEVTGKFHGTSAAIEFAVDVLAIANIVVLGHGKCGGISAALAVAENRPVGQFVKPWVDLIASVRDDLLRSNGKESSASRQQSLEYLAIKQSLKNLQTFPFVCEAVNSGRLNLYGAWFSIADAELRWLNRESGSFDSMDEVI